MDSVERGRVLRERDVRNRWLRSELLGQRVELAFLRFVLLHRKYAPSQPRIPAGQPGGGRWTDGSGGDGRVRVAQNGPFRPSPRLRTTRLTGRPLVGTEGEITELAVTRMQADGVTAAVRRIDRGWRPTYPDSLTETVRGEIAAEQYRLEAARARLRELGDPDVRGEALQQCLMRNGALIGMRYRNSDGNIRTVDRETFLDIGARLLGGAKREVYNPNYPNPQFRLRDDTVIGIRHSEWSDVAIEVLRGDDLISPNTKLHFRGDGHE